MKILAAVDGSPYTKRMLAYLAAHDEWLGAAARVHGAERGAGRAAARGRGARPGVLKAYYDEEAEKVFKPIRTFFAKQGLKANFVTKVGPAADIIAEVAEKGKFDLLMMGSHGHGTLTNLVMGSVATKVLAAASTPVLLIR